MKSINIHEAKTHLSRYLAQLEQGETILLCKRNVPIAEIRPVSKEGRKERQFGTAKGLIRIPPSFFDPLPDDELDLWDGLGS